MNLHFAWAAAALVATACATATPTAALVQSAQAAPGPVAAPSSSRERVRALLPQNVRVWVYEGQALRRSATGVVVGCEQTERGTVSYVMTNEHVVDAAGLNGPRLVVVVDTEAGPLEIDAEPAAMGKVPEMDLALVKVRGVQLQAAELATDEELEPGDEVLVVGAPYGRALSVSGGLVSQVELDPKSRVPVMLKTDAPIGYGASGGGVFSRATGRLLAIVEGYRTAKVGFAVAEQDYSFDVPMPGETFAAPSAKLRAFMQQNGFGRFLTPVGAAGKLADRSALR